MSVSMDDVRKVLDPEEPDYAAAARLGTDSLPHLRALVEGDDLLLAAKAVYAAGLLEGDTGKDVVATAARSDEPTLRVAAAGATVNLPTESAAGLLGNLVTDPDVGVRKVARASVPADAPESLATLIRESGPPEAAPSAPSDLASGAPLTATPMPGEHPGTGLMPGEAPTGGLMPGERPRGGMDGGGDAEPAPGKMPGESG
ncbi:HEAT repeat domain-containing protein [Streptomyces sp. NPDC059063]|uniref:HEAT repeat domain-containing protein n=1 Tax=unclassified Streptomyces TaxID=2593676 RepID=UPI0036B789FA